MKDTMRTPTPTAARTKRKPVRNDEGSMLLVMLFTLIMTALTLVVTATMITGLQKSQNSRDYATALQAADTAFADALMRANLGRFGPTAPSPQTSGAPRQLGSVTWRWTATRVPGSTRAWTINVEATGKTMDRNFSATIKGNQVSAGVLNTSTDTLRYVVRETENYDYGFFGIDSFEVSGSGSRPDFDGYNGAVGTVASNGPLTLGDASMDRIVEWGWTTDSGRCSGTYCPTVNGGNGFAETNRVPQDTSFTTSRINDQCSGADYGDWKASTNGSNPLVAGRCYKKLIFDTNITLNLNGIAYAKNDIEVKDGVSVNVSGSTYAPSSRIRLATLGKFDQGKKSKIAMAVYAPQGECKVDSDSAVATSATNQTLWLGAATCKKFKVVGSARFRYDGGLGLVNEVDSGAATGMFVWSLFDYQSID